MTLQLRIIHFFQDHATNFTNTLAELITILGEEYVLIGILAFIYFVYNKQAGERIAYSVFLSLCLNNAIKGLVKAPRPEIVDPTVLPVRAETATGYSFPSGHTQTAAAFYTSVGFVFKKKKLWIAIGVIIFLIGLSRVVLRVHFPVDVIVGALLGIGCALLGSLLYAKVENSKKHKFLLLGITAVVFLPFMFLYMRPTYEDMEIYRDFYTGYALFLGFIPAVYIENTFVGFDCSSKLSIRIIRFVIAMILLLGIQMGLKLVFPQESIFFDMLRYFLVSFVGLGLYPLTFKYLKLR
jgi:membrane-associated phospholipid phosphatase